MHACLRDYSTHVFRARRQSASACRHRQCRMNAGKEPCDKTTEKNCPKSALYLVAIACASTFFLRGERTCAGAPCLVSITLARSHVGAIRLNSGLLHFCANLMMRRRYFPTASSKTRCLCVSPPTLYLRKCSRFDRLSRPESPPITFSKQQNTRSNQKTKMRLVYEGRVFCRQRPLLSASISRLRKTLLARLAPRDTTCSNLLK